MAARYDIEAERGASFIFYIKYMDDSNTVVDLVGGGYTAEMQVKRFPEASTKLLHFSSTNAGVALGIGPSGVTAGSSGGSGGIRLNATYTGGFSAGMSGSTGGIYIVADPSTMSNVPVGDHMYDLEIIQGNTIVRLVEGRFVCKSNITE